MKGLKGTQFVLSDSPGGNYSNIFSLNGSEIVYASAVCSGALDNSYVFPVTGGVQVDTYDSFYCTAPCFVSSITVCDKNSFIRSIQLQCSDGSYSNIFGQSYCDGSGYTIDSPVGFYRLDVRAGNDLNGIKLYYTSFMSYAWIGCSDCQNLYSLECGSVGGQNRLIYGMEFRFATYGVHAISVGCKARRCQSGYYYISSTSNNCVQCPVGYYCPGGAIYCHTMHYRLCCWNGAVYLFSVRHL